MGAYSYSKAANILFTYELQKRLKGTGVTAVAYCSVYVTANISEFIQESFERICGNISILILSVFVNVLQMELSRLFMLQLALPLSKKQLQAHQQLH